MNELNEHPSASRKPTFFKRNKEIVIGAAVTLLAGTILADHFDERTRVAEAAQVQAAAAETHDGKGCSEHQQQGAQDAHACCNTTPNDTLAARGTGNDAEQECANH